VQEPKVGGNSVRQQHPTIVVPSRPIPRRQILDLLLEPNQALRQAVVLLAPHDDLVQTVQTVISRVDAKATCSRIHSMGAPVSASALTRTGARSGSLGLELDVRENAVHLDDPPGV
jgi:hypothetical protein